MKYVARWRGWLAVAAVVTMTGSAHAEWGNLKGKFVLGGDAPKPNPIVITKDQEVCGKHNLMDETLTVNPTNKGIQGIVLYMDVARGKKAPEPHPSYADTATAEVRLDNIGCRYEPHVVLLRTSQTLVVGNKDSIGHNTKVDTLKNRPINPIIPANGEIKEKFPQEERLPTKVSCSIHPWMNAIVVIKDTPYMAVTDADGNFTIANVPVGKAGFQVWQEKAGYIDSVTMGGKKTKWSKGKFEFDVKAGDNDMGELQVELATFK